MASGPWSDDEINRTVDVYFQMLSCELAEENYTKTEFRRLVEQDVSRSPKAIEYKFSNVSAVLDELGAVWIPGYKPLRNVQGRLRDIVQDRFAEDTDLRSFMMRAVRDEQVMEGVLGSEVEPPITDWPESAGGPVARLEVDFAAIESANRALGKAGEITVVKAERERLSRGGRADLAAEVCHVSAVEGDGLGYDVRSFRELTDEPVFIEVKTTRFGKEVPFYITNNEVTVSDELGPTYRLWRLYQYGKANAGHYRLSGPLTRFARLKPDTYRGLPAG